MCRHTQGTEGEALLALFPKGIKVLDGGVNSALTSAEDKTAPKLYCVSGKRKFKVSSVPLEAASLNSRDGFVLDCGSDDVIIQWVNTDASPALKYRTLDLADELEQEYHSGSAQVRQHLAPRPLCSTLHHRQCLLSQLVLEAPIPELYPLLFH